MDEVEQSMSRHPAGKKNEPVWDTAWALDKALSLGRQQEQERIIKMLETNTPSHFGLTTMIMNWVVAEGEDPTVQDCADFANKIIVLIKGENK